MASPKSQRVSKVVEEILELNLIEVKRSIDDDGGEKKSIGATTFL